VKVLFLNHPEADFGEFYLYNGFCELLGAENVIDVPFKRSYHGEVHNYSGYPRGYSEGEPLHWGLVGTGTRGCTAPFEYARPRAGSERSHEEVLDLLRSNAFEVVIVGSQRYEALRHFDMLRPEMRTDRIVMHDADDFEDVDFYTSARRNGVRLYLKRELTRQWFERPWSFALKPFQFSTIESVDARCDKQVDVLCAVGATHPVRAVAQEIVRSLPNARVEVGYWGWSRYRELIALSRIAVAPRGFGKDTARRWEIPQFDTLLMTEELDLIEDHPLVDQVHCVKYRDGNDLRTKLAWWCEHEDEQKRVAEAGHAHVAAHHTNVARARRVLEWVKEVYG